MCCWPARWLLCYGSAFALLTNLKRQRLPFRIERSPETSTASGPNVSSALPSLAIPNNHSSHFISNAHSPLHSVTHQLKTFQPDNRYVGNLTSPTFKEDTHPLWIDLVPKGLGFIEVPFPHPASRYPHLPPPYMKYNKPVYTTSGTHQLHCLYMIMTGMNELALNGGKFKPMDMSSPSDQNERQTPRSTTATTNPENASGGQGVDEAYTGSPNDGGLTREGEDPAEHLSHCFDYLRQAIMCHGDTALEGLQTTFGPDVGGSDGWNVVHVCKKWDEVYDWLEGRRIDDRIWI
jgi:hypothetical protein